MRGKRGQVAIFVIIAVVIVGLVIGFVAFRDKIDLGGIPAELQPVFSHYESCIEEDTRIASELLGVQGGRIELGDYTPGSDYAPFSSHLNFLGSPIGFWYYTTGNGVIKESVPTRIDMEREAGDFIEGELGNCDFSPFYEQGFSIELGRPSVETKIEDTRVDVVLTQDLKVSKGDVAGTKSLHRASVGSRLGELHKKALEIYNKEKSEGFLEKYAVDVLRSYAPVDGVNVQCSPTIWKTREVVDELKNGLSANLGNIKFKGDYYTLANKDNNYFVVDLNVDDETRVLYSKDWASKIEIAGDGVSQELMVAQPVGNQEGLGTMGFCYVPYHFVYDLAFPVMIQLGSGREIFQFPLVVIVDKNLPRNPLEASIEFEEENDVCAFKENDARIAAYDTHLNPIVGVRVAYQCFQQRCELGETKINGGNAVLETKVPVCVNGYLIGEADNYTSTRQLFSSNSETSADLILERTHTVKVNVKVDGQNINSGIVHFVSDKNSVSVVLPEQDMVDLSEGMYNVSVYVYGNSSVVIPGSTRTECTNAAKSGLLGFFGQTEEKCFEISVPETRIDYALRGGGKSEMYIFESDLEEGEMTLHVPSLPLPNSIEQLQYNFEIFSSFGVEVSFS